MTQEDENIVLIDPVRQPKIIYYDSESNIEYISNTFLFFSMSTDEDTILNKNLNKDVILEKCSVTYFAEYLSFKCIK